MGKQKPVRLIMGDDEYRVQQAARQTIAVWVPADQIAMGLETIDAAQESTEAVCRALDQCREALLTPAFFGMVKTVWLRDAVFLGNPSTLGDSVKERLRHLAAWITTTTGESARLLVSAPKVDKRIAFFIACKKSADVLEFVIPDNTRKAEQYAREQLDVLLAEHGLRAAPAVATAMVARTGADTRQLANEVEKLHAYLGEKSVIQAADVYELVCASRQSIVWDFTDSIGSKDLAGSLRVLRRLLFQKEAPVRLLSMLDSFIRDMILYRHAIDCGWIRRADPSGNTVKWIDLPPEVDGLFAQTMERDPRTTHPYRMGVLARTAAGMRMTQLLRWRELVLKTYRRLFSGNIPPEDHLELLLLEMLSITKN